MTAKRLDCFALFIDLKSAYNTIRHKTLGMGSKFKSQTMTDLGGEGGAMALFFMTDLGGWRGYEN